MKLLIFNGSPREGNTVEALKALYEGLADYPDIEVQEIKAADAHIIPCEGCDACMRSGDCIFEDDSIEINKLVKEADFFALRYSCILVGSDRSAQTSHGQVLRLS